MARTIGVVVALIGACVACTPGDRGQCGPTDDQCNDVDARSVDPGPEPDLTGVRFVVRTHRVMLADGQTAVPVLVTATYADGTPVIGSFVLGLDRTGGGIYNPSTVVLGDDGGASMLTPCTAATGGCLGPLVLTLAPAWSPSTIVARTATVLAVEEVGTVAACLGFDRRMHFVGHDFIHRGTLTVQSAEWMASGDPQLASVVVRPTAPSQGLWWYFDFTSRRLGSDLVPGVYEMAERFTFEADGHPGMSVFGDGRACNELDGRFQVFEYTRKADMVDTVTISFEQHCEHATADKLSGCVSYFRTDP